MSRRDKRPRWTEFFCPRIEKWVTIMYWIDRVSTSSEGGAPSPPIEVPHFKLSDCASHKICSLRKNRTSQCPFYRSLHPGA